LKTIQEFFIKAWILTIKSEILNHFFKIYCLVVVKIKFIFYFVLFYNILATESELGIIKNESESERLFTQSLSRFLKLKKRESLLKLNFFIFILYLFLSIISFYNDWIIVSYLGNLYAYLYDNHLNLLYSILSIFYFLFIFALILFWFGFQDI